MYLDKPMRNHVLLQAIARVNRPYVDEQGMRKTIGLVVDFVGVLRELKKALQFDSSDVSGVIEDIDRLMESFMTRIREAKVSYLDSTPVEDTSSPRLADAAQSYGTSAGDDEQLQRVVFGRFLSREAREEFYSVYRDIEAMWEILSPSPELRDHIATFGRLVRLYKVLREAYADRPNFIVGLAHKTRRLVEESATISDLGNVTRSVTFDLATIEALRKESGLRTRQRCSTSCEVCKRRLKASRSWMPYCAP